jgi:lariat debranching enzyme
LKSKSNRNQIEIKSKSIESMDKLTLISSALFVTADILAIISLILPDWIVSEVGGETRLGLLLSCVTIYGRSSHCYSPTLQPEWYMTLICIIMGCLCVTATVILFLISHWNVSVISYARWLGFTAMVLFCLAAVM